jgi:hypothetical protein
MLLLPIHIQILIHKRHPHDRFLCVHFYAYFLFFFVSARIREVMYNMIPELEIQFRAFIARQWGKPMLVALSSARDLSSRDFIAVRHLSL